MEQCVKRTPFGRQDTVQDEIVRLNINTRNEGRNKTNFAWLCNKCDKWNSGSTKRNIKDEARIGLDCKSCKKRVEIVYKGTWKVHHVLFPYKGDAAKYADVRNSRENPVGSNLDDPWEGWE